MIDCGRGQTPLLVRRKLRPPRVPSATAVENPAGFLGFRAATCASFDEFAFWTRVRLINRLIPIEERKSLLLEDPTSVRGLGIVGTIVSLLLAKYNGDKFRIKVARP
jgi:hypothetical protein